jgi:light-harvesting complex I chlorophyll a/b binding protein 3
MAAMTAHALSTPSLAARKDSFVSGKSIRQANTVVARPQRGLVVRATSDKPAKANRETWFASPQSLTYLDGTLPGDYGFDPLGLMDPEGAGNFIDPNWLPYAELINGRWAMLGAAGMIAPEILGAVGLIPEQTRLVWFKSGVIPPLGTYDYWADPYALFVLEIVLVGFAEHRRAQDYYKPCYGSKTPLLGLEKFLGGSGDPKYPGGPFFNFAGFGKDEASLKVLKTKEVKNARLAMLACLGYFIQAIFTGVGPFQNLLDHLSDPVNNNVLTNLKINW